MHYLVARGIARCRHPVNAASRGGADLRIANEVGLQSCQIWWVRSSGRHFRGRATDRLHGHSHNPNSSRLARPEFDRHHPCRDQVPTRGDADIPLSESFVYYTVNRLTSATASLSPMPLLVFYLRPTPIRPGSSGHLR